MLSYPLSHASRARIYPSDYVFFAVTSVTRGEERDGKRQKVGSGRQWKTCILGTHNEQNKDCDRDCLSNSTKHQMQQNELQLITSNCDRCDSKKHKTLVYTRMRAREGDNYSKFHIYNFSLCGDIVFDHLLVIVPALFCLLHHHTLSLASLISSLLHPCNPCCTVSFTEFEWLISRTQSCFLENVRQFLENVGCVL